MGAATHTASEGHSFSQRQEVHAAFRDVYLGPQI